MFNMTDDELLGVGVKIIDGIAGAGKSSKIDKFFNDHNEPYSRYTSTNRLRRDAIDRYNMEVKTVAAGLFYNHGTKFYAEEKEPSSKNIVIDEILQTHPKVIDWCNNHADVCNIIITTDSRQLLSPENEIAMKKKFDELKNSPNVIYRNLTETLRARNSKTKKLYEQFYELADKPMLVDSNWMKKTFPNIIYYEDMVYSPEDAYITHDNLTEDYLYKDQGFTSNPNLMLIPKGCLASKPPKEENLRNYPILSQLEADKTHTRSYTQVMNVGSAVRFQGSEVIAGQKLYFLIQPTSMISTRELYTVISRMWNIDSFVVVMINTPKPYVIKSFNNLPVKTMKKLTVDETGNTVGLSASEMEKLVSKYDTDTIYYDRSEVKGKNGSYKYVNTSVKREETNKRKSTVASLAKRDANLNYSYMDKVYSIFEEHGIEYSKVVMNLGSRTHDNYEIDMRSAHPTMLKYEKMPSDGILEYDKPHDDMLNFYLYKGDKFSNNSIITDDLKNYVEKMGYGECEYLFSTPYTIGTFPGKWLFEKATDTAESKADIKHMHYGYWMRHYLQKAPNETCYVRYENYIYELLICAIYSQILYYTRQIYDELNGTSIVLDGVYVKEYNEDKLNIIKSILPEYVGFRVRSEDRNTVYYQSYPELPTKKEKKAKNDKERRKKLREELEAVRAERSKTHE